MASLDTRFRADGGASYRVRWVLGGNRRQGAPGASETFSDLAEARAFKELVEANGEQWPDGWVKGCARASKRHPEERPAKRGHRGDWRKYGSRGTRCQLCGMVMPTGQWGFAEGGPLCRPDDQSEQNCYRLWVECGVRPEQQAMRA